MRTTISVEQAAKLIHRKPQNLRNDIRQGKCKYGWASGKHCYINWITFMAVTGFTEKDLEELNEAIN